MKTIAVFVTLLAVTLAAPQRNQEDVVLVREVPSDYVGSDNYKYAYELSDGQKRDESAKIEVQSEPEVEKAVLRVSGSYSYVGDDGVTYTINYTADENGFRPEGAHIPVAPAI